MSDLATLAGAAQPSPARAFRNGLLGLLLALGVFPGIVGQAAEGPLPLEDYWALVAETRAQLNGLVGAPAEEARPQLQALADQWERITGILLPDGAIMPVDHSYLVAGLRAEPPSPGVAAEILANLAAAQDAWPDPKHSAADLNALERILSRPEFQWPASEPSPVQGWWERLQREVLEFITRLFPEDLNVGADVSLIRPLLIFLGLMILGSILVYGLRGILRDFVGEATIEDGEGTEEKPTSAEAALKRARAHSEAGDYRNAVRYLYLSCLLALEEHELLRYDLTATNREVLRSVADRPELARILSDVVDVFDKVWYGYRPIDRQTYSQYATWVADLNRWR